MEEVDDSAIGEHAAGGVPDSGDAAEDDGGGVVPAAVVGCEAATGDGVPADAGGGEAATGDDVPAEAGGGEAATGDGIRDQPRSRGLGDVYKRQCRYAVSSRRLAADHCRRYAASAVVFRSIATVGDTACRMFADAGVISLSLIHI